MLPGDTIINKSAGRGGHLFVALRLASGRKLLAAVDTGAAMTVLEKSLEPGLGKRLGCFSMSSFGGKLKADCCAAPRLYLGNARLITGRYVATLDRKAISSMFHDQAGKPVTAILGMDCLRHYCIQLDFAAGRMRFLNPDCATNSSNIGQAFPLTFVGTDPRHIRPFIRHVGLVGESTTVQIDTGNNVDGMAPEGAFKAKAVLLTRLVWDNHRYSSLVVPAADYLAFSPRQHTRKAPASDLEHSSALGLSFLARHLVTFDFPKRTMYLKQVQAGPLAGDVALEISHGKYRAVVDAYESLRRKGRLPGLSEDDQGAVYLDPDLQSPAPKGPTAPEASSTPQCRLVTFGFRKTGDSSVCYYTAVRVDRNGPWKLKEAWRTDGNGHTLERRQLPRPGDRSAGGPVPLREKSLHPRRVQR